MNVSNSLFDFHPDWLAHTLASASSDLPETKHQLPDGTQVSRKANGVLWLTPPAGRENPNKEALIISAGVHGNETAPIEVLNGLVSELFAGQWQLACPALLMLGNPVAMLAGERFVDVNMNRLFNGAHSKPEYKGLPEAARARFLEEMCRQFAMAHQGLALSHYDLHTAIRPSKRERFALYPYVEGRTVPSEQCEFLLEAEVETLLLQHKAGTTFSSFSSSLLKAESFTVELGKVRPFGQNDLQRFSGIRDALRRRFREAGPAGSEPGRAQLRRAGRDPGALRGGNPGTDRPFRLEFHQRADTQPCPDTRRPRLPSGRRADPEKTSWQGVFDLSRRVSKYHGCYAAHRLDEQRLADCRGDRISHSNELRPRFRPEPYVQHPNRLQPKIQFDTRQIALPLELARREPSLHDSQCVRFSGGRRVFGIRTERLLRADPRTTSGKPTGTRIARPRRASHLRPLSPERNQAGRARAR